MDGWLLAVDVDVDVDVDVERIPLIITDPYIEPPGRADALLTTL